MRATMDRRCIRPQRRSRWQGGWARASRQKVTTPATTFYWHPAGAGNCFPTAPPEPGTVNVTECPSTSVSVMVAPATWVPPGSCHAPVREVRRLRAVETRQEGEEHEDGSHPPLRPRAEPPSDAQRDARREGRRGPRRRLAERARDGAQRPPLALEGGRPPPRAPRGTPHRSPARPPRDRRDLDGRPRRRRPAQDQAALRPHDVRDDGDLHPRGRGGPRGLRRGLPCAPRGFDPVRADQNQVLRSSSKNGGSSAGWTGLEIPRRSIVLHHDVTDRAKAPWRGRSQVAPRARATIPRVVA